MADCGVNGSWGGFFLIEMGHKTPVFVGIC